MDEPEVAWWESYGDPVLSDLVRRAAHENRDVKMAAERVRAARAGETVSRSWLWPSIGVGAAGHRQQHRLQLGHQARSCAGGRREDARRQPGRVLGNRHLRPPARRRGRGRRRHDGERRYGARGVRLLVLTDVASNYFTLVGALRQLETLRAISAAQDETLRLVTARQRAGLATAFDVERAQTDAVAGTRGDPAARNAGRRVAAPHRRAHRRPGGQCRAIIVPMTATSPFRRRVPASPPRSCSAAPTCSPRQRSSTPPTARRQQAAAEWFPRLFLGAVVRPREDRAEQARPRRRALHQRGRRCSRCRSSTPAAPRRSTRVAESGQSRSGAALRGRDRARARGRRERAGRARG